MGLFDKYRARVDRKVDTARAEAESRARSEGGAPDDVRAAGDRAARRKRRRLRFSGYGGAGGTS